MSAARNSQHCFICLYFTNNTYTRTLHDEQKTFQVCTKSLSYILKCVANRSLRVKLLQINTFVITSFKHLNLACQLPKLLFDENLLKRFKLNLITDLFGHLTPPGLKMNKRLFSRLSPPFNQQFHRADTFIYFNILHLS